MTKEAGRRAGTTMWNWMNCKLNTGTVRGHFGYNILVQKLALVEMTR